MPIGINYGAGLLKLFHDIVNEPPYIKDVRISGGNFTYCYSVTPGTLASFTRDVVPTGPSGQMEYDQDYDIDITFSEPVDGVSFSFQGINVTGPPGGSSDDAGNWHGRFRFENSLNQTPPSCDSDISLKINAHDRHNHFGGLGTELDLDPTTVAHRETEEPYNWIGYESVDRTVASFKAPCDCGADKDKTNPTITLASKPGCFNNTVEFTGSASDNCSLQSVTVNGQSVSIGEKGGDFSVTLNLPEGESTVTAVASDAAGNTAQTSVNVNVDSTAPKVVSKTPEGGPVALSAGEKQCRFLKGQVWC
jgi:hypothetical protein